MRTCPTTKKQFEEKHSEHYFSSKEAFELFVDKLDPMDEFVTTKRDIEWKEIKRHCSECGEPFIAKHPAINYCEKHQKKKTSEDAPKKKREAPINYFFSREKNCERCDRQFVAEKPAMKYCEECSDRGGKLVNKEPEKPKRRRGRPRKEEKNA